MTRWSIDYRPKCRVSNGPYYVDVREISPNPIVVLRRSSVSHFTPENMGIEKNMHERYHGRHALFAFLPHPLSIYEIEHYFFSLASISNVATYYNYRTVIVLGQKKELVGTRKQSSNPSIHPSIHHHHAAYSPWSFDRRWRRWS